ncbi:unnamed protein product [Notodromas monacha]|uniref:Integrase catalytic domain-containing protein n=1 Tax=Notodromas monacha TaxID=399045 RepID=A0A7R9GH39_9CRUS|nr:unnamed protein product [Notodromas monacha]CAG0922370.1 unnamed protein product [Notodromas monacha]
MPLSVAGCIASINGDRTDGFSLRKALEKDLCQRSIQDLEIIYGNLRTIQALSSLREPSLRSLCKAVRYERHEANDILYCRGELSTCWYILLSGSVFIDGCMYLPRASFGKRSGSSGRRPNECLILESSEMLVLGSFEIIHSEGAAVFSSAAFKRFTKANQMEVHIAQPYHPEGNGACERTIKSLTAILAKTAPSATTWDQVLYKATMAYNRTPHSTTGLSPLELWHKKPMLTQANIKFKAPPRDISAQLEVVQQTAQRQRQRSPSLLPCERDQQQDRSPARLARANLPRRSPERQRERDRPERQPQPRRPRRASSPRELFITRTWEQPRRPPPDRPSSTQPHQDAAVPRVQRGTSATRERCRTPVATTATRRHSSKKRRWFQLSPSPSSTSSLAAEEETDVKLPSATLVQPLSGHGPLTDED